MLFNVLLSHANSQHSVENYVLAHSKCDDISHRANLSDSYFTNRQDRYVLLEDCEEVADFFAELVGAVGDVSLQLRPDNSVDMMEGMVHPYKGKCSYG